MSNAISSSELTIGIDIGGTKVLGGVVDSTGKIIDSARRVTPAAGGKELITTMIEVIKEFKSKHEVAGVGISIAALISACLLYTSPSPRDRQKSRMPSSA